MDTVDKTDNIIFRQLHHNSFQSKSLNGFNHHTSPSVNNLGLKQIDSQYRRFPPYRDKISYTKIPADHPRIPTEIIDLESTQFVNRVLKNDNKSTPILSGFWLENPSLLFESLVILPHPDMNDAERLNAMTRMIIIIAAIMFIIKFQGWLTFLVIGMLIVIIMWYIVKGRPDDKNYHRKQREYIRQPRRSIIQPIKSTPDLNANTSVKNYPLKLISIP
jgi:hypothetical protein